MGSQNKNVVVVADTHFGLYEDSEVCDPKAFGDFLKWIGDLERGKQEFLELGAWGSGEKLLLEPPDEIIFLGDIIELWTATNESVLASTMDILPLLSELNCEKIYILGNHDNDLREIEGKYPLGASDIEIIENTKGKYPLGASDIEKKKNKKGEYWIYEEEEDYCFLHGHQFDDKFDWGPLWKIMGLFRKAALAFGDYAMIFFALFLIDLSLVIFFALLGARLGIQDIIVPILLAFLSVPSLILKYARGAYNKAKTLKFKPLEARSMAIEKILNRFPEYLKDLDSPLLNVVYGHTHTIGSWEVVDVGPDGYETLLMNIMNLPSWVKEPKPKEGENTSSKKEPIEKELSHVFLYKGKELSPIFVGWDTEKRKPYFIPKDLVFEKREKGNLLYYKYEYDGFVVDHQNIKKELEKIGWPKELTDKWIPDFTIRDRLIEK